MAHKNAKGTQAPKHIGTPKTAATRLPKSMGTHKGPAKPTIPVNKYGQR